MIGFFFLRGLGLKLKHIGVQYLGVTMTFWSNGAWARGAKYPVVITKIIYSFLPSDEVLFIEQRIRYLIEAKELVRPDDYCERYNYRNFAVTLFRSKRMYEQEVELGCDLIGSVVNSKRVFNSVRCRIWMFEYPTLNIRVPVPFECRCNLTGNFDDEEECAQYIASVILKCNLTIEKQILDKIQLGVKFVIKQIPSSGRCFPLAKSLRKNHLRTMRSDRKLALYPTPSWRCLHLLL